jgi:IrrE N-terminal-like domain
MSAPRSARGWAQQLVHQPSPTVRAALATDPKRAVVEHLGLRIRHGAPGVDRGFGGWCDGLSVTDDDQIIYQPTPSSRRENFTVLHEAGHHLSERDERLLNWAHQRPDPGQELERISDYFAAAILPPQELIQRVLAGGPVEAQHLPLLYQQSTASREVCAIALADQLGCEGCSRTPSAGGHWTSPLCRTPLIGGSCSRHLHGRDPTISSVMAGWDPVWMLYTQTATIPPWR